MYQTVISHTDGRKAVDGMGRSYFVAGSAPVVAGKKVWTDGKIIYGSLPASGAPFIPIPTGELIYVNHSLELFSINGTEAIKSGNATGGIIGGKKGNAVSVFPKNLFVLSARCSAGITTMAILTDDGNQSDIQSNWQRSMFTSHKKIHLQENENIISVISLKYSDFSASVEQYTKNIAQRYTVLGADKNFAAGNGSIKIMDCCINDNGMEIVLAYRGDNYGSCSKEGCQCNKTSKPCTDSNIHYTPDHPPTELLCGDYYRNQRFLCGDVLRIGTGRIVAHCNHDDCGKSKSESVSVYCFRIYHLSYDKNGQEVNKEVAFEICTVSYSRYENSNSVANVRKILKTGNEFICTVDNMQVKYQYAPGCEDFANVADDEEEFIYQASVELDGKVWQAPAGLFIESIKKYKGKYYIVLRNGTNKMKHFHHAVCIVDNGKTITPKELTEKESDVWQVFPSTMQLPVVSNMGKLLK